MSECPICLEILTNEMCFLTCECIATYHTKCIGNWLIENNTCPTCNRHFNKRPEPCNEELRNAIFYDSIGKFNTYIHSRQ